MVLKEDLALFSEKKMVFRSWKRCLELQASQLDGGDGETPTRGTNRGSVGATPVVGSLTQNTFPTPRGRRGPQRPPSKRPFTSVLASPVYRYLPKTKKKRY